MLRTGTAAGLLIALLALSVSCATGTVQNKATGRSWIQYQGGVEGYTIRFDHPPSWQERPQKLGSGTMDGPIAVFTTQPPKQSFCYSKTLPSGGGAEGCDESRLGSLRPGNVFLVLGWFANFSDVKPTGETLIIDGHDAYVGSNNQGCGSLGGDSSSVLTIYLDRVVFATLDACALGVPDLAQNMQRVTDSVHLTPIKGQ